MTDESDCVMLLAIAAFLDKQMEARGVPGKDEAIFMRARRRLTRDRLNQLCCHFDTTRRSPSSEVDAAITRMFNDEMTPDDLCDFITAWTHKEPSSDFRVVGVYEVAEVLEDAGWPLDD